MSLTFSFATGLAPACEFLLFDRGGDELFAIDAFAVQEVLPLGRAGKLIEASADVEARGERWPVSDRAGESLALGVAPQHAIRLGRGGDARAMLVVGIHSLRSSLGASREVEPRWRAPPKAWLRWPDGLRAALLDHQWRVPDPVEPSAEATGPMALLATPSGELYRLCSQALAAMGWRVQEAASAERLLALAREAGPSLVLIDPSFESGAGYAAARAVKSASCSAFIALVAPPQLPPNAAMIRWCAPDWAGTIESYEALGDLLIAWSSR